MVAVRQHWPSAGCGSTLVGHGAEGDGVAERRDGAGPVRAANLDLPPLRAERRQATKKPGER